MSKLVESSQWEEDLYQIETSDPVEGGPDGVSNKQAKQLGGRTRYLKQQVEQSQSGITQHVTASDPHPQYATKADLAQEVGNLVGQAPESLNTLKEFADALGKDPNFATTMTNALALKAPIESPVFTGTPKGTTPAQFDSTTALAPTAFVQRALGNASSMKIIGAAVTMGAAYAGADVVLYGNSTSFTQLLPAVSSYPAGVGMRIYNASAFSVTIQAAGSDKFSAAGGTVTSIVVGPGDSLYISSTGAFNWELIGGTAAMQWSFAFDATLDVNGSQRLPSGYIEKWGSGTTDANGEVSVVFPKRFPNAALNAIAMHSGLGAAMVIEIYGTLTQDGVRFKATNYTGASSAGWMIRWRVLGK
ncbi:gp53-like domain-containing protein [Burkholderia ubonensis]|uniref:gp53-like domain-containing protein n=1 Tax=Burkholderia ubonensis TaxID=101571 RepID=UPI0009B4B9E8|nr:hypothetical protein [Burkholderia ubonensis]